LRYLKQAEEKSESNRSDVRTLVTEILENVKSRGEAAVRTYSEKFDDWNPKSFRLTDRKIAEAGGHVPADLKKDILFLRDQVRNFAEAQKRTLTDLEVRPFSGVVLGHKYLPIQSVGLYVPGGRYTLIASSQMSIVPAKVAGVERVVACTPVKNGALNPAVVYAIHTAGADEIYSLGGAQAIAAMAFGIPGSMQPVDMIAGPGNAYVLEAKRQVFGQVGIDLLAGPSEIGIIADDSADPRILAADLLAQAEHDPDSKQYLIVISKDLGSKVMSEIEAELRESDLPTTEVANVAWHQNGEVVEVSNQQEAVEVSDSYAPEHQVQTRDLDWFFQPT